MLPGVTEIAAVPPTPARRRRRIRWDVLLPALVLLGVVLLSTFPSLVTDADPQSCQLGRSLEAPSAAHPFGFSVFGCDYLAESIYASRTSLTIAALTVVGTTLIALVLGSGAGFYGGWVDVLVSRFTDVWTAVPLLLGAIVVLSALRVRGVLTVSLVLIVFGWPAMVRLQRASVQEAAAHEYVTAARALGARPRRVLLRHVLPNALRPLLSYASAYAGLVIGIEATLTYVGVGLQQPVLSWGQLLLQAQDRLSQAPHLIVPAFMLVLVVSSLVLLAQGLRRAADPLEG
ncbi:MAG: peptide transporter permease [Frankiales bacterium]|jgi:oligopeptide transport system permease protein|nr:peptide transporter permease [Frankiales bacterium]